MEDIKLQPVNQMQQVQAPGQENVPKDQQEKLPSYSERYYDDFFEYRCSTQLMPFRIIQKDTDGTIALVRYTGM